jgi:CBS domain-containing protein
MLLLIGIVLTVSCSQTGRRHLPVVADKGEQVIGMVSIRDLLGTAIRLAGPS